MSDEVVASADSLDPDHSNFTSSNFTSKKNWRTTAENAVVSVALFAMVVIPLAESFLRRLFHVGIPASTTIVQHMVLVVGMLGGAIAAREGRLLALSTLAETALHGRWKSIARIFTGGVSAAVTAFLGLASYQFVETEREAGTILGYGIPIWVVELVLPLGFAVIAIRILLHTSDKWLARGLATAGATLLVGIVMVWPAGFHHFVPIAISILFLASVLGMPAFATLGGAALILFWGADQPIAAIPIAQYGLVTNPILPTLPLFTLAGYFLAEGGAPKRLVRVFYALFGQFRGGPAIVTVSGLRSVHVVHRSFGCNHSCARRLADAGINRGELLGERCARTAHRIGFARLAASTVLAAHRLRHRGKGCDWTNVPRRNHSGLRDDGSDGALGYPARICQQHSGAEIRMAGSAHRAVGGQVGTRHASRGLCRPLQWAGHAGGSGRSHRILCVRHRGGDPPRSAYFSRPAAE